MFDGSLNEDVTEHIGKTAILVSPCSIDTPEIRNRKVAISLNKNHAAHSLRNRKRPSSRSAKNNPRDDVFCEMCNGHQRVVYQLLSNYIPDEEVGLVFKLDLFYWNVYFVPILT